MIRFSCPGCGAVYSVTDDKAGKTGKCPKCQTPFTIPAAEAPAPAPPPVSSNPFSDLSGEDDAPRKKKAPSKAADLDDAPPKKKPARRDDDSDDAPPKKKAKGRRDDDDYDDDAPPKKKPARRDEEDDDDDDRPKKKARRDDEEDDDDDRPRKKKPARSADDDYDDDYDDRPRKTSRSRRGDDYDDRIPATKPGLATAAAILWLIWGAIWAIILILNLIDSLPNMGRMPTNLMLMALAQIVFTAGGGAIAIFGGVQILKGSTSSLKPMGLVNLIYCIVVVVGYTLLVTVVLGEVGTGLGGRQAGANLGFLALVISCGFLLIVVSGHLLGSIFALVANKRYTMWWKAYGPKKAASSSRRRNDDDDYDD